MNRLSTLAGRLLSGGNSFDDHLFIDAGSSNTRIFFGERLVFSEPTCVAVHLPSSTVIAVGSKAEALLGKTSADIEVSFPIQYGVIAQPEYFEVFLKTIFNRLVSEFSLKRALVGVKVWCSVPAKASPVERQFMTEVLGRVGFGRHELVPASEAAFLQLVGKKQDASGSLILDVGGQSSDIGIFSAGEMVDGRTIRWGGVQFTEALQEMVRDKHQCAIGWHIAEQVKKDIGEVSLSSKTKKKPAKTAVRGKDVVSQVSKTVLVSSNLFDEVYLSMIDELYSSLEIFFASLPSELVTSALDQGLYLTGSASQLAGLGEVLSERMQSPVNYSPQPDTDVVKGMLRFAKLN